MFNIMHLNGERLLEQTSNTNYKVETVSTMTYVDDWF